MERRGSHCIAGTFRFTLLLTMNASLATHILLMVQRMLAGALAPALVCGVSLGAQFTVKVVEKEPPKEVDAAIRKAMQLRAVQLLDGNKVVCEWWLSLEVPLKSKPDAGEKALPAIKETTFLGVVAVH